MDEIRVGTVARCQRGALGLITQSAPTKVTYGDGSVGRAWVGIHLTSALSPIGSPWSSRAPTVLGQISDLVGEGDLVVGP